MTAKAARESVRWMYHSRGMQGAIISMAALSLIAGVVQCIVLKWQNRTLVVQCTVDNSLSQFGSEFTDCKPRHFTQAFLQTLFMFAGECVALPFYFFVEKPKQEDAPPSVRNDSQATDEIAPESRGSLWWWMTPAPLDFLECALGCIAFTITYASTVQMLHNFMVISSAVFTMLIIRTPLRVHEWLGCLVVTAALVLSSLPALNKPEVATESHHTMHWLGILLAVVSTCIHSLQNIWEEALFRKNNISATFAVGLEGITGLIISMISLPLVELTGYESPRQGWRQLGNSSKLRWGMVIFAISSLLNNLCGIAVTKWASGLLRCLFMSVRAPLVWAIEMYFGWNSFDWSNFASMFVLCLGLALYMLVYPFSKFTERTRNLLLVPITFGILSGEPGALFETEMASSDEKLPHASTPATGTPSII